MKLSPEPASCHRVALIVEDDFFIREDLVEEFQRAGWSVLEAGGGDAALAFLKSNHSIDVVVTDIQLPGTVSGWDVAEAFRAEHADVPIVYASGNSIERSRLVTGSRFYAKPYGTRDILDACRKFCESVKS